MQANIRRRHRREGGGRERGRGGRQGAREGWQTDSAKDNAQPSEDTHLGLNHAKKAELSGNNSKGRAVNYLHTPYIIAEMKLSIC